MSHASRSSDPQFVPQVVIVSWCPSLLLRREFPPEHMLNIGFTFSLRYEITWWRLWQPFRSMTLTSEPLDILQIQQTSLSSLMRRMYNDLLKGKKTSTKWASWHVNPKQGSLLQNVPLVLVLKPTDFLKLQMEWSLKQIPEKLGTQKSCIPSPVCTVHAYLKFW